MESSNFGTAMPTINAAIGWMLQFTINAPNGSNLLTFNVKARPPHHARQHEKIIPMQRRIHCDTKMRHFVVNCQRLRSIITRSTRFCNG